jgi:hypothetical protein
MNEGPCTPVSAATAEPQIRRLATDRVATLCPRAAAASAGHASRRASPALPMPATRRQSQPEQRDGQQPPNPRRAESRAVELTQSTVPKPMRRAHRRPSAVPGARQRFHLRSLGRAAPATSLRGLQKCARTLQTPRRRSATSWATQHDGHRRAYDITWRRTATSAIDSHGEDASITGSPLVIRKA